MGRKPNVIEVNRSALIWLTDHGSEKALWGRGVCWGCDSMTDQSRQIWLCNDIKFTCPSEEIVLEATITLSFNSFSRKDRRKKTLSTRQKGKYFNKKHMKCQFCGCSTSFYDVYWKIRKRRRRAEL